MLVVEQHKRDLEAFLAEANEPPPLLHPEMANFYRRRVDELHELLQRGPESARLKAADMPRALISAIVLTPNDEGLELDVQGIQPAISALRRTPPLLLSARLGALLSARFGVVDGSGRDLLAGRAASPVE